MSIKPSIELEIDTGLATITVSNPAALNALSAALARDLVSVCSAIDADEQVGAVVLRGASGYFCSGALRNELATICEDPLAEQNMDTIDDVYNAFLRVMELRPPVVAAIQGGAVGAGLNLALACDVRVVAEDARLASGFARLGVHPGGGHYSLLARTAGPEFAAAFGLLGVSLDGRQAVERGLAWQTAPHDEVDALALEMAHAAAADPSLARRAKASLRSQQNQPSLPASTAAHIERAPQLWSFARKGSARWHTPERTTD